MVAEGSDELRLPAIEEAHLDAVGFCRARQEDLAAARATKALQRLHDGRLVGRRQAGIGIEGIHRRFGDSDRGQPFAPIFLEIRRAFVAQILAQSVTRAAGTDGDAGAAGYEGESGVGSGLAKYVRGRKPLQLLLQRWEAGIGIDAKFEGKLATSHGAAGDRSKHAVLTRIGSMHGRIGGPKIWPTPRKVSPMVLPGAVTRSFVVLSG